jgi:hypothetical protein
MMWKSCEFAVQIRVRSRSSHPMIGTVARRRVYASIVESHTFRRVRHGRRFLCHKTYILQTGYNSTGLAANRADSQGV